MTVFWDSTEESKILSMQTVYNAIQFQESLYGELASAKQFLNWLPNISAVVCYTNGENQWMDICFRSTPETLRIYNSGIENLLYQLREEKF